MRDGKKREKSIVLLSGGMDSAVALFLALRDSFRVEALYFDYAQRASKEFSSAKDLASIAEVDLHRIELKLNPCGSVLTDRKKDIPGQGSSAGGRIPATYVPARNLVFLAFGVNWAESIGAEAVYIGAHQLDFSNYPDCREEFFDSFRKVVKTGTRSGDEGRPVEIITPIIDMSKKEIILLGQSLGVPFEKTWSCYSEKESPCLECESCLLRKRAFAQAGFKDPLNC